MDKNLVGVRMLDQKVRHDASGAYLRRPEGKT
ncbi:hypothetical protein BH24ACT18_BH24ACT18_22430 [soil metagenome]